MLFMYVLLVVRSIIDSTTGDDEFPLNHVSCGSGIPNAVQAKLADCV